MSVDTLTADAPAVVLTPPPFDTPIAYTVVSGADEVAVAYDLGAGARDVVGYDLAGNQLFTVAGQASAMLSTVQNYNLVQAGGGGFLVTWNRATQSGPDLTYSGSYQFIDAAGHTISSGVLDNAYGLEAFAAPGGARLEWNAAGPPNALGFPGSYTPASQIVGSNGTAGGVSLDGPAGSMPQALPAYASAGLQPDGSAWDALDNFVHLAGSLIQTQIPGEPASAITDLAMASLGQNAVAVGWVDSGTDYVSLLDTTSHKFGPVIGLDWGGASNLHMVALPDGGFVVSWENGGAYKGEVFDAAGNGGGIMALAGDVAGIDSHGDLYTVGLNSSGQEAVQTYAINGSSSGGGGGTAGQTFNSDNNGDTWVGTAGDDVFNLGRGGDTATGNGGNDTYNFAGIPWAGGRITDFNAGDVLDLTGLMSTTSDTGTDGFADGYLKITSDSAGNAQVWADHHIPGNDGWWLVETLDGVSASSLSHSGDVITVGSSSGGGGGPTDVSTSDSSYTAPASVKTITLTGSQQHIDASATSGVTINSNDSGNALIGGAGDDLFHLGRGGDWATGGAGADTFAYAAIPWAGGGVTDFSAAEGDRIDVSGLLANASYTGTDPIADGYLKFGSDGAGNAQLLADYNLPGNDGWWLVATLDGVSTSSLHYAGGLIT